MGSGLYDSLVRRGLLVPHEEVPSAQGSDECYKIIRPEALEMISHSYKWSFRQLKDAALATPEIQNIAFEHGMVLKDASAFNIQFRNGQATLF